MRKYLLLMIVLLVGLTVNAQNARKINPNQASSIHETQKQVAHPNTTDVATALKKNALSGHESTANLVEGKNDFSQKKAAAGIKVGTTKYDLQTNNSLQRRIVLDTEGTAHMSWTLSRRSDFTDRGTGYNYVDPDGTTGPEPSARIDLDRTGWPDMAITGSDRLVSIAHFSGATDATLDGLAVAYRDPGDSEWTTYALPHGQASNTWGRVAAAGDNVHVICAQWANAANPIACGFQGGIQYFRSTDGAETWDIQGACVADADGNPLMSEKEFGIISGDSYAIDANGDNVAFILGPSVPTVLWSNDNGETWQMKRLTNVSDPLFGGAEGQLLDWTAGSDESFSIVIDDNGVVHVWYGLYVWGDEDEAAGWSFLPQFNGIKYWNSTWEDGVEPRTVGPTVKHDLDGDSVFLYDFNTQGTHDAYFSQLVSFPSGTYDDDGNLYLVYRSVVEGHLDANGEIFSDVFVVKSSDDGQTWEGPVNLTNDPEKEDVYASVARKVVDGKLHIMYQSDALIGTSLQGFEHEVIDNDIYYLALDVEEIKTPTADSEYAPKNTLPDLTILNAFFGFEGCDYDANERIVYFAVDYPDGDLDNVVLGGNFLDNIGIPNTGDDNIPGTPDDGENYQLTFNVSDSDGNELNEVFDGMYVYRDSENPFIVLNPYDRFLEQGEDGEIIEWDVFGTSNGLFIFDEDDLFYDIDIVQGSEWTPLGAEILDDADFAGCPATIRVTDNVDPNVPGTYQVCYGGTDFTGKEAEELCRTVNVIAADVTAPMITLYDLEGFEMASGDTLFLEASQDAWLEPGYIAFDRVDLEISDGVTIGGDEVNLQSFGTYEIIYTISDMAGNEGEARRYVSVADREAPVVNVPGNPVDVWACATEFIEPNTTALDVVDGDITDQLELVYTVECEGTTYEIEEIPTGFTGKVVLNYTVSDASGNQGTGTKTYQLYDTGTGCADLCTKIVGYEEPELNGIISVFPNPTNGDLTIDMGSAYGEATIQMFDAAGKLILTEVKGQTTDKLQLNIADQTAGVYLIKITTDAGTAIQKIVLDK